MEERGKMRRDEGKIEGNGVMWSVEQKREGGRRRREGARWRTQDMRIWNAERANGGWRRSECGTKVKVRTEICARGGGPGGFIHISKRNLHNRKRKVMHRRIHIRIRGVDAWRRHQQTTQVEAEVKNRRTDTTVYPVNGAPSLTYGGGASSAFGPVGGYSEVLLYCCGGCGYGYAPPYCIPDGNSLPPRPVEWSGRTSGGGVYAGPEARWTRRRWSPQQKKRRNKATTRANGAR
ncbi:hypothetical protein B0H11DRAFT_1937169 [Mycena galericulata]|nr:hypothetical protein B0H11DRAFT_1937169 [Mycena galericulata]